MSLVAAFEKVHLCHQCVQPILPKPSGYGTLSITRKQSISSLQTHHQTVSTLLDDTHVEAATWMKVTQHEAYTFSETKPLIPCAIPDNTLNRAFWIPQESCSHSIPTEPCSDYGNGSFWIPQESWSDAVSIEPLSDSAGGRAFGAPPEPCSPSPTSTEPSSPCLILNWRDACALLAAPRPLCPRGVAQFLEVTPTPRLSSEFFKDLSSTTVFAMFFRALPALSRPDHENISTLTLSSFHAAAQCHAGKYVVEFWYYVFQFWNEGQLILSGSGTSSSALEWIEIVSMDLVAKLWQSFEQVAVTDSNSMPLDSVLIPLLDFAVNLQDLPTMAPQARQVIVMFFETLFSRAENGAWSAPQCIAFSFDYYHGRSLRDTTFSVACLDIAYESLHNLIQTSLENGISRLERDGSKEPILCLASLLKFFRIESWIHLVRIIPYQMLSRLLHIPSFDGPGVRSNVNYTPSQAAAIVVVLACSDLRLPGCTGCVGALTLPETQDQSLCICRMGMILDQDYREARSFMKQGDFSRGFEILLQSCSTMST